MINLIKNELTKIFHKKAIYIVLIIALAIMILGVVLNKVFESETTTEYFENDKEYLKQELSTLNKDKPEEKEYYAALEAELQAIELSEKYNKGSWQEFIIAEKGTEIIQNMLVSKGTDSYEANKKTYDNFLENLSNNDWKAFAKAELEKINQNIKDIEEGKSTVSKQDYEETIANLKDERQAILWRIDNNIPYGNSTLNDVLTRWQATREQIRDYDTQSKTKEKFFLSYNK